ncbi:hypothetical protein AU375_06104 [Methylobacterium radiotolerans]|nr:hypothetical protein AU375_06104 [Methylobacterium radiotolerans]
MDLTAAPWPVRTRHRFVRVSVTWQRARSVHSPGPVRRNVRPVVRTSAPRRSTTPMSHRSPSVGPADADPAASRAARKIAIRIENSA